ncbi:MAG: BsuPI-related putative proteinase inhibitor [Candidatus Latescibacterota bacterium]
MRRIITLLFLFLLLAGAQAFAQEDAVYFPLDQGRIWVYDDGNIDKIESFLKYDQTRPSIQQFFVFSSYNFARRAFYREGLKIYEWNNNFRRLWYDFGAKPGDSWEMKWEAIPPVVAPDAATSEPNKGDGTRTGSSGPVTAEDLKDINDGAIMTLVAVDEKVSVPYGEFGNVYHFRIKRPGVADAAYVEEWFAPGIGCVQRTWDTIAGPHTQKLAKLVKPEPVSPLRVDVYLDKEKYREGEDIQITVSVLNWSDRDVTLEFPSSLQVDYTIDDAYTYSKTHPALTAVSSLTIKARDVYKWTFTHTSQDYAVPLGMHHLKASLIGTKLVATRGFEVYTGQPYLPSGVGLYVKTSKEMYAQGEGVKFTLTVANRNKQEVSITVMPSTPIKYQIGHDYISLGPDQIKPAVTEVKIPANSSVNYTLEVTAENATLEPGYYVLVAGLRGYQDEVYTKFTVQRALSYGTVTGYVFGYPTDLSKSMVEALAGAQVTLYPVVPKNYERDMSILPVVEDIKFSAVADEKGGFTLEKVPVGAIYVLRVTKEGYLPYGETIRTLNEQTSLKIGLRPAIIVPEKPLNYRIHEIAGLVITFGTDRGVYQPESPFKAILSIRNTRTEAVTFKFAGEPFVDWYLDVDGKVIQLTEDEKVGKAAADAPEFLLEIKPGETKEYVRYSTFKGRVPAGEGKYSVRAALRFTTCSITELKPGDVGDYVRVLVVPGVSSRLEANGYNKEMVVDTKETTRAVVNIVTKTDNVNGEIAVTEIVKNLHKERSQYRFVKMVEVDADADIRSNMDNAVVRIYYRVEDFPVGFKPEKLVISHWDDKSDDPKWEDLETRVDTVNKFVEATTTSFSSFALFEQDAQSAVDETAPVSYQLSQNVPNPFNPSTTISFQLPSAGQVRLSVYNVAGQEVARLVDGPMAAGSHSAVFDGSRLASGVYFYRLQAEGFTNARKMLLIK